MTKSGKIGHSQGFKLTRNSPKLPRVLVPNMVGFNRLRDRFGQPWEWRGCPESGGHGPWVARMHLVDERLETAELDDEKESAIDQEVSDRLIGATPPFPGLTESVAQPIKSDHIWDQNPGQFGAVSGQFEALGMTDFSCADAVPRHKCWPAARDNCGSAASNTRTQITFGSRARRLAAIFCACRFAMNKLDPAAGPDFNHRVMRHQSRWWVKSRKKTDVWVAPSSASSQGSWVDRSPRWENPVAAPPKPDTSVLALINKEVETTHRKEKFSCRLLKMTGTAMREVARVGTSSGGCVRVGEGGRCRSARADGRDGVLLGNFGVGNILVSSPAPASPKTREVILFKYTSLTRKAEIGTPTNSRYDSAQSCTAEEESRAWRSWRLRPEGAEASEVLHEN
ncbi:hypothetical protein B0H11DRAFT_2191901 [Mycena galericulata]|nr:hypothetical protein B0H11DRAFT_2191901 [Mycena galericulata]